MVLFEKKEGTKRSGESSPPISTFNIPGGTITWISVIYLIIQTLSTAISAFITKSVNNEVENQNFVLKEQNFKLQMLQRVMELEDPNDRKTSIKLLIRAGFMKDENKTLENFVDSNTVPKWKDEEIEKLSSYLSSTNSGSWTASSSVGSSTNIDSSGHRNTVRGPTPK